MSMGLLAKGNKSSKGIPYCKYSHQIATYDKLDSKEEIRSYQKIIVARVILLAVLEVTGA